MTHRLEQAPLGQTLLPGPPTCFREALPRTGVLALSAVLAMGCSMSGEHRAEELGCARHANPRTVQICRAIANEMEFKLMGHNVPAPGYKVTTQTLVRVYCQLDMSKEDEAALRQLTVLGDAAGSLLKLIGAVWVDGNNILSPAHPRYVLKDGCPPR